MVWTKKKIRIKKIGKNLSVLLRYNSKLIVPVVAHLALVAEAETVCLGLLQDPEEGSPGRAGDHAGPAHANTQQARQGVRLLAGGLLWFRSTRRFV